MIYMNKVAEMLGVEIDEYFNVIGCNGKLFKGYIDYDGLKNENDCIQAKALGFIIMGAYTIEKLPWVPKPKELFYLVNEGHNRGYGAYREFETRLSMLVSRGVTFYKTESEAQARIKEFGWNID